MTACYVARLADAVGSICTGVARDLEVGQDRLLVCILVLLRLVHVSLLAEVRWARPLRIRFLRAEWIRECLECVQRSRNVDVRLASNHHFLRTLRL